MSGAPIFSEKKERQCIKCITPYKRAIVFKLDGVGHLMELFTLKKIDFFIIYSMNNLLYIKKIIQGMLMELKPYQPKKETS